MEIISVNHKGLQKLLFKNDASLLGGKNANLCKKLQLILGYILQIKDLKELFEPILKWKAHFLSDGRVSLWVTGNWRLTFEVIEDEIHHLNLEDYH